MIIRVYRNEWHDEWVRVLRQAAKAFDAFHREAVRLAEYLGRAFARIRERTLVWQALAFDEARPKKHHVFWRLVCWLVPRRLRRGRAAGIGCKNWRRS